MWGLACLVSSEALKSVRLKTPKHKGRKIFPFPGALSSLPRNRTSVSICYPYSDKRTEAYSCLGFWAIIKQGFEVIIHWTRWSPGSVHEQVKTIERLHSDNMGCMCCIDPIKSYSVLEALVHLDLHLGKLWRWHHCFLRSPK